MFSADDSQAAAPVLCKCQGQWSGVITEYEKGGRVLDALEPILHDIAGRFRLTGATIERWIWDSRVVRLGWQSKEPPQLGRNIAVQVVDASGDAELDVVANIEINAWLDRDGRRHWQHKVTARDEPLLLAHDLESENGRVRENLYRAYEIVASWTAQDLGKENELLPAGNAGE